MCIVSDKLICCTCSGDSYEDLPHYWVLYRFNKHKDLFCMGEAKMPLDFQQPHHLINQQTLLARLNEADAFDKNIGFKAKDQLEIVINNLAKDELDRMTFCFKFIRGKWVAEEYDAFELMQRYDDLAYGDFKHLEKDQRTNHSPLCAPD